MAARTTHSLTMRRSLVSRREARPQRQKTAARLTQAPTRTSSRTEIKEQIKEARQQMAADENLSALIDSLRGSNLNEDNFAKEGLKMRLMEEYEDSGKYSDDLPLIYDHETIASYWGKRKTSIVRRVVQLAQVSSGFATSLLMDFLRGELEKNEVQRAIQLRDIVTSLGPAYIKLGQALAIRPDILSPASMREMQKLCDKVPSFDNDIAMKCIQDELGAPWYEIFADLSPSPIAAASLGQVYKGKLKTGEQVAVKVQRPYVIETVTIDLYIIRTIGLFLRRFPKITERVDVVGLLDEWAARFFEELDYEKEGRNGMKFAQQMKDDLPQIVVPKTFMDYTRRRVLTIEWIDGEKLSQSTADDVRSLVNVGVICYLKQLLDTGFFHADPHPGNLIRTPDGRLAILDFGLMTQITDNQKYGMIFAISHLIHRDYSAITEDFVNLDFIPPNVNLKPLQPVLSRVFDQALEGGGAKNINFQELASDLAQITFDYPFRIPPYFALIIRAIGVLEGIALVGDPDFAIVDEAYPYIAKRLLTDSSSTSQEALRYMIYGQGGVFDVDRLIDILEAFEEFIVSVNSTQGSRSPPASGNGIMQSSAATNRLYDRALLNFSDQLAPSWPNSPFLALDQDTRSRQALSFLLSDDGILIRKFLLDELVKSVDALSRVQIQALLSQLGLQKLTVPLLLPVPGMGRPVELAPKLTEEDKKQVDNVFKLVKFLSGGNRIEPSFAVDILPYLPSVTNEILPEFLQAYTSRLVARSIREVYNID